MLLSPPEAELPDKLVKNHLHACVGPFTSDANHAFAQELHGLSLNAVVTTCDCSKIDVGPKRRPVSQEQVVLVPRLLRFANSTRSEQPGHTAEQQAVERSRVGEMPTACGGRVYKQLLENCHEGVENGGEVLFWRDAAAHGRARSSQRVCQVVARSRRRSQRSQRRPL